MFGTPLGDPVTFSVQITPYCWAHSLGCDPDCAAGSIMGGHPCNELGTGKLGLCPAHEEEILPPKDR
jgi:hypothetical protein